MKRLTNEQIQAGLEFLNLQINPTIGSDLYICLAQLEMILEAEQMLRKTTTTTDLERTNS